MHRPDIAIGHPHIFSIETKFLYQDGSNIYGYIRFIIDSHVVGNWQDVVLLNACTGWLQDFAQKDIDRYEPEFASMSKEEIFHDLYDSIMPCGTSYKPDSQERFQNSFNRFYVSHLGGGAFDTYDLLLVETEISQRVLWREAKEGVIREKSFKKHTLEKVAQEYVNWFQKTQ